MTELDENSALDEQSIIVVGLGGAGARIVDATASIFEGCPTLAVIDTDSQCLKASHATTRLQIGAGRANGQGTGGDVAVGRMAAEDDIGMVRGLFSNMQLAVMVVGLGGGAGMGAAPSVLSAAREAGAMTICCATMPFAFEDGDRASAAEASIDALRRSADVLVILRNDALIEVAGVQGVEKAFDGANEALATCLGCLWRMLTHPGYLSLGFPELRRAALLSDGVSRLVYGEGRGRTRVEKVVQQLFDGPLSDKGRVLRGAKAMVVSLTGGPDFTLSELGAVMEQIKSKAGNGCRFFVGTVVDERWRGRLTVTVVASEQWVGEFDSVDDLVPDEGDEMPPASKRRDTRKRTTKRRALEEKLRRGGSGQGRFGGVEATILYGENIDVPTYLRRGLKIGK